MCKLSIVCRVDVALRTARLNANAYPVLGRAF